MEAYKNRQYEGCAKFFAQAMQSDDLSSFVDYIAEKSDGSALHGTVGDSENTMSPSLASASKDEDLSKIVEHMNNSFCAEMSDLDEEIEEIEVRASLDDPDLHDDEGTGVIHNHDVIALIATAGPVGIKK